MARKHAKYDGTIFNPSPHIYQSNSDPNPLDLIELAVEIADEAKRWLLSKQASKASPAAIQTAADLVDKCRFVISHAKQDGKQVRAGLFVKSTPKSILELGYLWCQFRVQAAGFEQFAGSGISKNSKLVPGGKRKVTDEELLQALERAKAREPTANKTRLIQSAVASSGISESTFWRRAKNF